MAKRTHPWDDNWEELRPLGKGGQGRTVLVRRRDAMDDQIRVLKVLSRQDDLERRSRMYREIAALETIDHPQVPKLFDSNGAAFRDISVPLYMIMGYVDGASLDQYVAERGRLSLEQASKLALSLLEAVAACHRAGLVHRDIKPDNIVMSASGDAHLVDWGLSFNSQDAGSLETGSKELGNRFLHLPELQEGDQKRENVSDLTQVVGIFFFTLTAIVPRLLSDGQGRKPHQREEAAAVWSSLESHQRLRLLRLFDQGFDTRLERRFGTADALVAAINGLRAVEQHPSTDDTRLLLNIKNRLTGSHDYADSLDLASAFEFVHTALGEVFHDLARYDLEDLVAHFPWGNSVDLHAAPPRQESAWGLQRKLDKSTLVQVRFNAVVSGNEIVLSGIAYDERVHRELEDTREDICRIALDTLPASINERQQVIRRAILQPCRSYMIRLTEKYGNVPT